MAPRNMPYRVVGYGELRTMFAERTPVRVSFKDAPNQEAALEELAQLTMRAAINPVIAETAVAIIQDCPSRASDCELYAIYNAVKHGTHHVRALAEGLKYVPDPIFVDLFTSPVRTLEACLRGACGEDCDGHAALVAAMCARLGFLTGITAWGPDPDGPFEHVLATAYCPRELNPSIRMSKWTYGRPDPRMVAGMDTTVDDAHVWWLPDGGRWMTRWLIAE